LARIADPERKTAIFDAAERLFSARGYHATSVRDIAAEIDRQGASLYAHVGGKEDILWGVVSRAADEFFAALAPILAADLPPVEKLRRAIAAHVRVVTSSPDAATVYLHEWQQLGPARRAAVRRRRDEYEGLLRGLIAAGVADGSFAPVDPKFAGLLVLSAVNGVYQWYRPGGALDPEQIAAHLTDLILNGLLPAGKDVRKECP
jgi:AcrR family transcriptional regulator